MPDSAATSEDRLDYGERRCRRCGGFRCQRSTPESCDRWPAEHEISDDATVSDISEMGRVILNNPAGAARQMIGFGLPQTIRISPRREPNAYCEWPTWKLYLKALPDSGGRGLIITQGCTFARLKEARDYLLIHLSRLPRKVNDP